MNNRGLAYRKKGDLDNAIQDYTAAIALNPIYALAYNNRGYVYEAQGRQEGRRCRFPPRACARSLARRRQERPEAAGRAGDLAAETDKLVAAGQTLAERNCAWCHAIGKTGDSPNPRAPRWRDLYKSHPIQALRDPLTRGIARPHDEMPKFELSDEETDTIVAYINSLNP